MRPRSCPTTTSSRSRLWAFAARRCPRSPASRSYARKPAAARGPKAGRACDRQWRGRRRRPRRAAPRHARLRRGSVRATSPRGASSCARARTEYAACLDVVSRLAMARPDIGFTLEHDGRRLHVQGGQDRPARVAALTHASSPKTASSSTSSREGMRAGRRRGPADLQPRRCRSPISVRQRPSGEGPAARRRAARRLCRFARARSPPGRRAVPRLPSERGRRQRPSRQDRGALSRPAARPRADRRGPAPRARRRGLPQRPAPRRRRARRRGSRSRPRRRDRRARRSASRRPVAQAEATAMALAPRSRTPYAAPSRSAAPRRPTRRRPTRATTRSASRAGRSPTTYIVAEAEDGLVIVDQHAAHERLVLERLRRGVARAGVAAQGLLLPEVVELDEAACDRLEARADELAAFGLEIERFGACGDAGPRHPRDARPGRSRQTAHRSRRRTRAPMTRRSASRTHRPRRRDDGVPRLGSGRTRAIGRRNERAAARNGSHPALGPMQPRPPDLGEDGLGRCRKAVRAQIEAAGNSGFKPRRFYVG